MELVNIIEMQRSFFKTDQTKSLIFRKSQLLKLKNTIKKHEKEIYLALKKDLNKSSYEAYLTELAIIYHELDYFLNNLRKLDKNEFVLSPLAMVGGYGKIIHEPYGVCLILAPWNYPFHLAIAPLIGAIACGNTVILKSSSSAYYTSLVIKEITELAFEKNVVSYVDHKITHEEVLAQNYDFIFFTGSKRVGKIIMESASKNLTPVVLELGGKSPVFIDKNCNLKKACKRIIWAKLLNAGQTCVAPDYILVHEDIKDELIKGLQDEIDRQLPEGINDDSYPSIINLHHYERLLTLISHEKYRTKVHYNHDLKKISLTLFTNTNFNDEIMQDEIFGPILPIISYNDLDEVTKIVKNNDKPLACYIFSKNQQYINHLTYSLSFGGACINDCMMHLANHNLPFGGVGPSGMGQYHGKYSFNTFTHSKPVQNNTYLLDFPLRYRPFTKNKKKALKLFF